MKRAIALVGGVTFALAGCATAYGPPPAGSATVTTATKAPYGTYLVDAGGRALYILEGTRNGGPNRCTGEYLRVWPPLHAAGRPVAGGAIDAGRLGAMPMHGAPHVTYSGWPLYYYHRDRAPADTTGQHVTDAWGTWHLLFPAGEPIRPRPY